MTRWLLRIFVFLLLGAIVNVAVAWGLSLQDCGEFETTAVLSPADIGLLQDTYAWDLRTGRAERDRGRAIGVAVDYFWYRSADEAERTEKPSGSIWDESNYDPSQPLRIMRLSCGWPALCLTLRDASDAEIDEIATDEYLNHRCVGCFRVESRWFGEDDPERHFPLRPIWPGFAINTVFYAVVLWLLFAGPFVVRRWRRIRRGLCPKCAYDLRATRAGVCPECGATR